MRENLVVGVGFFFNGWGAKCISFSSLCCSLIDSKCLQLLIIALLPSLGHHAACRVQGWQTAGLQADLWDDDQAPGCAPQQWFPGAPLPHHAQGLHERWPGKAPAQKLPVVPLSSSRWRIGQINVHQPWLKTGKQLRLFVFVSLPFTFFNVWFFFCHIQLVVFAAIFVLVSVLVMCLEWWVRFKGFLAGVRTQFI